jgi:hypothetical protein
MAGVFLTTTNKMSILAAFNFMSIFNFIITDEKNNFNLTDGGFCRI